MHPSLPSLRHSLFQQQHIHLWLTSPSSVSTHQLQSYFPLLSTEERQKQQRYRFERHQHQYLITRALVRTTLSKYFDLPPQQWLFSSNSYGKPAIHPSLNTPPIHFNLSHTDGFIVLALSSQFEIGVDVEKTERVSDPMSIADRFFSKHEIACLQQLPPSQQRTRFFQYWTLGEAYIKARGMGLAIPLAQFTFHLDTPPQIEISFGPQIQDDPSSWQFHQSPLSPQHLMALAIQKGNQQPDLHIQQFNTLP